MVRDETDDETRARSTRSTRRRLDRAPAARRHRAFARRVGRRSRPVDASGERARVSPRSLESSMDGRSPPRDRASRARVVGRPTASSRERDDAASRPRETRARRAASARDARVARGKRERERETGRRARTTRADAGPRPRRRATRFFLCASRHSTAAARDDARGRERGANARMRMCDFELIHSIAIVRRARRCASPPRARL